MAQGRFLSRSISTSEQVAGVSIEAALLFSWCIPHLDVDGKVPAEAGWIKANVVPMRDEITLKKIPKLFRELAQAFDELGVSLVVWYRSGRHQVLLFPGFAGQQQGLRREREAPSRLPDLTPLAEIVIGVPPADLRSSAGTNSRRKSGSNSGSHSGSTPAQGEVEVEVEVQEKVKSKNNTTNSVADAGASDPPKNWVADVTDYFREQVGHVEYGHVGKKLKPYVEREGVATIKTAINYYALERQTTGRAGNFKWFLESIAQWIENAKQPLQLDDGTFTPLGERLYGLITNGARR